MRKHISVLMLICRSIVYKLLLLLLAMTAAEAAMFSLCRNKAEMLYFSVVDSIGLRYAFIIASWLAVLILVGVCTASSSKTRYTLARLSLSEKGFMFWHWLCGVLTILIVMLWQTGLLYALGLWHKSLASPDAVSAQSIYLSSFRSGFFHSLLPLEDPSRLVRSLIMAISLGGVAAAAAFKIRRGALAWFGPSTAAVLYAATFDAEPFETGYDGFLIFAFLLILLMCMLGVFTGTAEVDYEEESLEN